MADVQREVFVSLRDALQDVLRHMPATGLDGRLSPVPLALANVLKWLRADEQGQALLEAWCQAVVDGNDVLAAANERAIRASGFSDFEPNMLVGDAEWRAWLQTWGGPAEQYVGKASHVRAREAYHAWLANGDVP